MKKILETLRRKWAEYLLEIIVIMIGIFGAFMLNNWNEQRKESIQQIVILQNLKSEFKDNLKEIERTEKIRFKILASINEVFDYVDKKEYNIQKLDSLLSFIFINPSFDAASGNLNNFINSSSLSIISNNNLRNMLISWPGLVTDLQEEETFLRNMVTFYSLKLDENISIRNISNYKEPKSFSEEFEEVTNKFGSEQLKTSRQSDYKTLFQDRSFENLLSRRFMSLNDASVEGQVLMYRNKNILKLLDIELEQK